jgi:hypothetical protein
MHEKKAHASCVGGLKMLPSASALARDRFRCLRQDRLLSSSMSSSPPLSGPMSSTEYGRGTSRVTRYWSMLPRCSFSRRTMRRGGVGLGCNDGNKRLRTEVPLPTTKHLQERGYERPQNEVRPTRGDVDNPNEADKDVGNLQNSEPSAGPKEKKMLVRTRAK